MRLCGFVFCLLSVCNAAAVGTVLIHHFSAQSCLAVSTSGDSYVVLANTLVLQLQQSARCVCAFLSACSENSR